MDENDTSKQNILDGKKFPSLVNRETPRVYARELATKNYVPADRDVPQIEQDRSDCALVRQPQASQVHLLEASLLLLSSLLRSPSSMVSDNLPTTVVGEHASTSFLCRGCQRGFGGACGREENSRKSLLATESTRYSTISWYTIHRNHRHWSNSSPIY